MKNFIFLIFIFLITSQCILAQSSIKLSFNAGYQQENFGWSIAGNSNGENPNILSEVNWRDLSGSVFNLALEKEIGKSWILKANSSYFTILKGCVNDTDYSEDNRQNPVFQSNLNSNKGIIIFNEVLIGFKIELKNVTVAPLIAYSKFNQQLYLTDQENLNSSYETRWNSLGFGCLFRNSISRKVFQETQISYYQSSYNSKADWNLRPDFAHPISFTHQANGNGISLESKFIIQTKNIQPYIFSGLSFWDTGSGIDQLFYADGREATTQFNSAERKSFKLGLGLNFLFKKRPNLK